MEKDIISSHSTVSGKAGHQGDKDRKRSGLSKSMNDFRNPPPKQQQQQQQQQQRYHNHSDASKNNSQKRENISQKVSVVVTIDPNNRHKSPTRQLRISGISGMFLFVYASILAIIAIIHSIINVYDTVEPDLFVRTVRTIFAVYIYSVATICYIYIELDQYLQRKVNNKEVKKNRMKNTSFAVETQSENEVIETFQSKANYFESDDEVPEKESKRSSKTFQINEKSSAKAEKEEDIRGYLRINNTSRVHRRVHKDNVLELGNNDEVFLQDIPKVDEEEDVFEEMFIDLSRLGSIFSHHGSSFFLRIGSLLFGVGHIIYITFELLSQAKLGAECTTSAYWWELVMRLFFVVLQMFVLFKNPQFTIKRKSALLHKFGYVHIMATNLCMWINTLTSEIDLETSNLIKNATVPDTSIYPSSNSSIESAFCTLMKSAAPYLFPFILEYCLLCVSIVAVLYFSLKEEDKTKVERGISNLFRIDVFEKDKSLEDGAELTHETENFFSKSHRGIFTGCLFLAATIICIVFFRLILTYNKLEAEIFYLSVDLIMNATLLGVGIVALYKLNALSFIGKPRSIDDVLIFLALCGGLTYHISILYATLYVLKMSIYASYALEILRMSQGIVCCLQIISQVALVSSGLRRYPLKSSHLINKPGRTCLTFLVIGNITAWIFHSTLAKTHQLQSTPTKLYGDLPWIVLSNITLPLLLFFYFHSSVCLADIWHIAYHTLHGNKHVDNSAKNNLYSTEPENYLPDVNVGNTKVDLRQRNFCPYNNLSSIMRSVSVSQLTSNSKQAVKSDIISIDSNVRRNFTPGKSMLGSEPLDKIEEYENFAFYM